MAGETPLNLHNYRLVTNTEWLAIARTQKALRENADGIAHRLAHEHSLLLQALHELAIERGLRDPKNFIDAWVRERPYRLEPWEKGSVVKPQRKRKAT